MIAYVVAYDGALFDGFIGGPNSVRAALSKVIRVESVASRTDPGVSAVKNVVASSVDAPIGLINSKLRRGVWVLAKAYVEEGFNARRAIKRTYVYLTKWLGEDLDAMRRATKLFIGEKDFRSFAIIRGGQPSRARVFDVSVDRVDDVLIFRFSGKGFRNKMIRKIVWALRAVGRGLIGIEDIEAAFREYRPVPSAPAEGLVLVDVDYGRDLGFEWDVDAVVDAIRWFSNRWVVSISQTLAYKLASEELLRFLT